MRRTALQKILSTFLTLFVAVFAASALAQQTSVFGPPQPSVAAGLASKATLKLDFPGSGYAEGQPFSSSMDSMPSFESGQAGDGQQQPSPDAAQAARTPAAPAAPKQSKRVLGIVPNFRAVGTNAKLPPQSVKDKFVGATEDSFDYSSTIIPALLALYGYERNSVPQFGTGGVAFGRYLWHSTVDQTTENYMVEFFVPVLTREDTRYYTLGHGGFFKRTGYALSRAFVTRSDSGKDTFNISEIAGAGASAGMSNLYYPEPQRTLSTTANNWSLDVGLDASTFVLREFWPDIDHRLFHDK